MSWDEGVRDWYVRTRALKHHRGAGLAAASAAWQRAALRTAGPVEQAAQRLRELHNVCGDDRGCQCEEAVAESRRLARELLEAAMEHPAPSPPGELSIDPVTGRPVPLLDGMRLLDYDTRLIIAAAESHIASRGQFQLREIRSVARAADPTLRGRRWTRAWHEVRDRYVPKRKRIAGRSTTVFVSAQAG